MEEGFTSTLTDTSNGLNERISAETKFQCKKSEATFRVRLQCQSQAQNIGALGSGCRSEDPHPRWWTCSGGSCCSLQLVLQQRQRSEQLWGKAWLWPAPSETLSSGGSWRPTRASVCIAHMIAEEEDNHELCDHNAEVKYVSRGNSQQTITDVTSAPGGKKEIWFFRTGSRRSQVRRLYTLLSGVCWLRPTSIRTDPLSSSHSLCPHTLVPTPMHQ